MRKPLITFAGLAVAALAVSGGVAFAAQDENEPRPPGTIFVAPPLFETKSSSSAMQDDPGRQTGSPDGKAGKAGDNKCEWDDDADDRWDDADDRAENKRERAEDRAEDRWDDDADDRAENKRERAEDRAEDKRERAEDRAEDRWDDDADDREARDGCE